MSKIPIRMAFLIAIAMMAFIAPCRINSHQLLAKDDGIISETEVQEANVDLPRVKRAVPAFIPWLVAAVAGAAVGATYNDIVRFNNEIRSNECGVLIKWYAPAPTRNPGVRMNFKSQTDDNWNHEALGVGFGEVTSGYYVDKTRERIDGGKLKLIQFWWDQGQKACIKDIVFICGDQVTGIGKKNVALSHIDFGIRARMQNKMAHVWWAPEPNLGPCIWFSHSQENIRAVDLYPGIFACNEFDAQCKANNMQVFIN